jgi:hypothetical protein
MSKNKNNISSIQKRLLQEEVNCELSAREKYQRRLAKKNWPQEEQLQFTAGSQPASW